MICIMVVRGNGGRRWGFHEKRRQFVCPSPGQRKESSHRSTHRFEKSDTVMDVACGARLSSLGWEENLDRRTIAKIHQCY